jgi:hypothetical protein
VNEDEMGGSYSIHGRLEMHTICYLENLKGRDHSEDLDIDGKIILEWFFGK